LAALKQPLRAASAGVDWIGIVAPTKRPVRAKTKELIESELVPRQQHPRDHRQPEGRNRDRRVAARP